MGLSYQPSSLFAGGVEECIIIDQGSREEKKPVGRRGVQERLEQRKKNNGKKSTTPAGEKELRELMRLCEYEVEQDPYRGMGFLKNDEKVVTPWDICQWGILSMPKNNTGPDDMKIESKNTAGDSVVLDSDDAENLVRNLTESNCPSILAWTKEHLENRKKQQSLKNKKQKTTNGKKRNRSSEQDVETTPDSNNFPSLGIRPSSTNYHCPCDANPFCLGSMGGIIDELLKERCQKGITISIVEDEENSENDKDKKRAKIFGFGANFMNFNDKSKTDNDSDVEIVDVDQTTKTGEGTDSDDNVFAFMGNTAKSSSATGEKKKTEKVKRNTEASVTTTATCEPLGPEWSKPEIGEPSEVFSSKNYMSSQPFDEEGYSPTTKAEIDKLRKSENVDMTKVKRFIQNLFELYEPSGTDGMTMEEYIETMTEWHKSLIFVNPMIEESSIPSNELRIALPPGIQNLGATCYLNTQLQCLAQIPVFLDGIFSWRPVNSTHMMNGVMTKLQKLLAQLLVGGDGKYTSLDFSNALGIQHNEQQDPNEFARLLFDRMEESFEQCSNAATTQSNSNNGTGLGKLLHRIFHGTTTYETICMKCGKTSVRSEGFMDLNLPIVHREHEEEDDDDDVDSNKEGQNGDPAFTTRKRRKKGVLEKAFEKQKRNNPEDTDVQYCFDQYTKTEMLTGDNQYFCDDCNSKQDAKRVMSLTELPPVLNIQLSRYVFDRQKFIKKKLTDKVRLPTILTVDRHDSCSSSASASKRTRKSEKKYILCAVMKHRGTSAYSGHYIAEAMDWTIGQWYEFNDEIVKILPTPSNSYVPNDYLDLEDDSIQKGVKSPGSEDAYNMYYVDEDYLAEHSVATMFRNKRLNSIQNGPTKTESEDTDVLSSLIREKFQGYSVLSELCYVDYTISERLRRRKDGIRQYMFVDPSSMLLQEGQGKEKNEPYYWVDGKTLRQFLACDRSLNDKLGSGESIVCPQSFLCEHGCLHPRTARHGKLLRKSLYDSYASLLSAERKYLSATSEVKDSDVIGREIIMERGMACEICSKSYRKELGEKLEFLRNVYDVYLEIIDETKDAMNSFKTDSTEEQFAFILTRSTITKFKKLVVDLMKSVADFAKGGDIENNAAKDNSGNNSVFDGVDNLDISSFPGSPTYSPCSIVKTMEIVGTKKAKSAGANDQIDEKFNSKITCSHGNCNDFSARIIRYVSAQTWAKIKKIFPSAIEHKVLLYTVDGQVRKPNVEEDGCVHCRTEKDAVKNLSLDVERWAKETKGNFVLKKILDGKNISLGEIAFHNFDSAQNNCRLVHRDDITNLCSSVKKLRGISRSKISEHSELKTYVENLAFPSYHSVVLDFEKQPHARLLQSIRSLTCCEHKRVIKNAIIGGLDGKLEQRHQLSNNIVVLSDEEYTAYINALAELLILLNRDYHQQEGPEENLQENLTFSTLYDDVKNFAVSCHPTITMFTEDEISSDEVLLFSLDGNSKEFSIIPGFCNHETCKNDFVPIVQKNSGIPVDSVSVDSTDELAPTESPRKRSDSRIGSAAMSPIIVESDLEDAPETNDNRQKIRVFECLPDSESSDAMQSLKTVTASPNSDNSGGWGFVRRSTRKRKVKFPVGCILSEDIINIGLHHNFAALRLLLFQDCRIPLGCKLSIAISKGGDSMPKGIDIPFDASSKTLNEQIDLLKTTDEGFSDLSLSNPTEQVFVLYKVEKGDKCKDIEATLMDSLIEASNIESTDAKSNATKGRKTKNRSSERGFQGTLLQSSNPSGVADDDQASGDSDVAASCPIDDSKQERKRARSNTIISDDDMDEVSVDPKKDDSSDDEVAIIPSPPVTPRMKSGDDPQIRIVRKLIELTDSKDESRCFEAVTWAIKSNPKCSDEEIINAALNKIFDAAY